MVKVATNISQRMKCYNEACLVHEHGKKIREHGAEER
jgi:hypothetical protein